LTSVLCTDGKVPNEGVVAGGKQSDQLVEKKSKQLFALLEDLRSAKGERGNKIVAGEWKVETPPPCPRTVPLIKLSSQYWNLKMNL
jgi:hypothetical protein